MILEEEEAGDVKRCPHGHVFLSYCVECENDRCEAEKRLWLYFNGWIKTDDTYYTHDKCSFYPKIGFETACLVQERWERLAKRPWWKKLLRIEE